MDRVHHNVAAALKKFPETDFEIQIGETVDRIVVSVSWYMTSQEEPVIESVTEVPRDWWEAFKERWLPFFRVRYRTIVTKYVIRRMSHDKPARGDDIEILPDGKVPEWMQRP